MAKKMGKTGTSKGDPANMRSKPNPAMRSGVGPDPAKAFMKGRSKKK